MQIKFNFTSGLEFASLNSGIEYQGYYSVDDKGTAYNTKYIRLMDIIIGHIEFQR